jgi:hypothetical protein
MREPLRSPTIGSMALSDQIVITFGGLAPVSGEVHTAGQPGRAFTSWIGLLSALEQAVGALASAGPPPSSSPVVSPEPKPVAAADAKAFPQIKIPLSRRDPQPRSQGPGAATARDQRWQGDRDDR